jgi:CheY-like chemotaxis protein
MSNSKRIIIADDDENDCFLLRWAFGRAGLKELVVFARDGQEAIHFLQTKLVGESKIEPRLLLLDIRMPRGDGFEVLRWLQNNAACKPPHVVVFSSSCDPRDIAEATALGADEYMVKPCALPDYMELVREFEMRAFDENDSATPRA